MLCICSTRRRNKQHIVRCKSGDLQLTCFAVSPLSQKGALRYHLFGSPMLNSLTQNKIHPHEAVHNFCGTTHRSFPTEITKTQQREILR